MHVDELPDDPKLLKQLLADRQLRIAKLELELLWLKKRYYGPRADTLTTSDDVAQLLLSFAQQVEQLPAEVEDLDALRDDQKPSDLQDVQLPTARRVGKGRRNLQQLNELPTVRKEYDLPDDQKPCPGCGEQRVRIGQETSWQIEYIPG